MVLTFLTIAAGLLTAGGPSSTTTVNAADTSSHIQRLATSAPDSWQAATSPHHLQIVYKEPASLPEQNLDQKVKTSRAKSAKYRN